MVVVTELGTGYISIVAETSKVNDQIKQAFKGAEPVADKSGSAMGGRLAKGLGKTLKTGGVAAAATAGAAMGTALVKGVGRLTAIDDAEAKLSGLGHSARGVEQVMGDALASVKGTAFGLGEAATTAAGAVAAGIKPGQDLERALRLTGDAASIAGVSIDDMGAIFNKVAASNKLMGGEIMQLEKTGIPVVQLLADTLGTTTDEVRELASAGEISFAQFEAAMEAGLGGAALKAGDTFRGSLANLGAAAGRLGATVAGPFFEQAKIGFGGATALLDDLNDRTGPVMDRFGDWLTSTGVPSLRAFGESAAEAWAKFRDSDIVGESVQRLGGVFRSLQETGAKLAPSFSQVATSLAKASAATGVSTWKVLLSTLESAAKIADATLVPAMSTLGNLMEKNQGVVNTLAMGFLAFKTVPRLISAVSNAFQPLSTAAQRAQTQLVSVATANKMVADAGSFGSVQMGRFGSAIATVGAGVPAVQRMQDAFYQGATGAERFGRMAGTGAAAAEGMRSAMGGVRSAARGLLDVVGGPLNAALIVGAAAFAGYSQASAKAAESQRDLASRAKETIEAHSRLAKALTADASGLAPVGEAFSEIEGQISSMRDAFERDIGRQNSGMEKFGLAIAETVPIISWLTRGTVEAANEAHSLGLASEAATDAIDGLGMSTEQMAAAVYGSEFQWDSFRRQLEASGEGGRIAATEFGAMRDRLDSLRAAQERATPGAFELAGAMEELADTSKSASDKANSLRRALQALGVLETDAEAAMFEVAAAVDEVAQSAVEAADAMGGFGDALHDGNGVLDATLPNAHDLRDSLRTLGDEMIAAKASGADVTQVWSQMSPVLDTLAQKYGLQRDEIEMIAARQGLIKPEISTLISVDGDAARTEISEVALMLGRAQEAGQRTITIPVNNEVARRAIRETGLEFKVIDEANGLIEIDATNTLAMTALQAVAQEFNQLDEQTATPRIGADDSVFMAGVQGVADRLDDVDGAVAVPRLGADPTAFRLADDEVKTKLAEIDRTEVSPEIDAVIDGFLSGRDVTVAELMAIDETTAKPEVIAIIDEAMRRARVVDAELDRAARNRTATITVQEFSAGTTIFGASGIGGRAAGGRLPTTGPGTDRTDGILAVTGEGQAVSWVDGGEWVVNRESSAKHDRLLAAINADDPRLDELPALRDGGRLRDLADGAGMSRPLEGAPYVFGGINWGDCSAAMSAFARDAVGLDPAGGRFATANQGQYLRDLGFSMGRGGTGDLRFGWFNGGPQGGHTAGTLPDGTNVEMGGGYGGGKVGGTVGADHPQFTDHAYLEIEPSVPEWEDLGGDPSDPTSGRLHRGEGRAGAAPGPASGTSSGGSEQQMRMKTASELMKDGAGILVDGFFETLGLQGTALTDSSKLNGPASDVWVTESVPVEPSAQERATGARVTDPGSAPERDQLADVGHVYDPAAGVEQWSQVVEAALDRVGGSSAHLGRTLEQIDIESGGDPGATNDWDSNAAAGDPSAGLLQVIGKTFAAYRDPELPDDRRHPLANVVAALRYVDDRYGGPGNIWPTASGYYFGGRVTGGQGGIDDVPAWLTRDEHVVRADAARRNRPVLDAMNAGVDVAAGGSTTYAPVFNGIGMDEMFARFERWTAQRENRGVRATTSRRR